MSKTDNRKTLKREKGWMPWMALSLAIATAGCAGTEQSSDQNSDYRNTTVSTIAAELSWVRSDIHSVQLYASGDQSSMPVVMRDGASQLTLAFDQIGIEPRNFRIFFQHADRNWQPDLLPVQFMERRQEDELLDYTLSSLTDVHYAHYRYTFPNDEIIFKISGNYLIRVTEYDDESDVVIELPFMVSEELVSTRLKIDQVLFGDSAWPLQQPIVDVRPPSDIAQDIFNFSVCFVRNGRLGTRQCPERAFLASIPDIQFKLEPEEAFEIEGDLRRLDLSFLDTGGDLVYVDKSTVPYEIDLEVDYPDLEAGFEVGGTWSNSVYGSSGDRPARSRATGEYASVNFRFQPPNGVELDGEIYLTGSYDSWTSESGMTWNSVSGYYETTLLLKQGRHLYRYVFEKEYWVDNRSRPLLNTGQIFDAFVYYRDDFLATDRLVGRSSIRTQ